MRMMRAGVLLAGVGLAGGLVAVLQDELLALNAARLVSAVSAALPANPAQASGPGPSGLPPAVPMAEVVTRTLAPMAEFTGHFQAAQTIEVRSRVAGAIDAVSLPEGRIVRPGQPLFQINPRPFEVALEAARAQLHQAQALVDQAEADLRRTESLAPNGLVTARPPVEMRRSFQTVQLPQCGRSTRAVRVIS